MEEEQVPPAVESGESPTAIPNPEVFASDGYAAKAPWNVFDCGKTPRAKFDDWLESNRPSQVYRYDGDKDKGPVDWITVRRADHSDTDHADMDGLQESWDKLLASGRTVNFQAVKELALNHRVLSGKWLMHLEAGFKLDHAWECVARAVLDGKILQVKVSTRDPASGESRQVICMYNRDFTDEGEVMRLDTAIRATGVKCPLSYKPDVYTHLGIYRNNCWKLCPTIYDSKFNLECVPRRSLVVNKVTNLEVT
ncbi:hypothetical protein NHX12_014278 [Muraenolepis orangiensis]|uniref:Uncharacterized protein n=1 Tax=Muraenolepis orangiensis TaxID=630683 RepID=A0A9Q0DB20_9TELE|nr:hypothetical protein NHX12_014278 [Muraenolepis orangiensis]